MIFLRLGSLALSWSLTRVGPKSAMDIICEESQIMVSANSRKDFATLPIIDALNMMSVIVKNQAICKNQTSCLSLIETKHY